MFDLSKEPPITLQEAADTARVTFPTVLRWVQQGAPSPAGRKIHLEAVRLGGRWMTSQAAIQRFAERLTPRPEEVPA